MDRWIATCITEEHKKKKEKKKKKNHLLIMIIMIIITYHNYNYYYSLSSTEPRRCHYRIISPHDSASFFKAAAPKRTSQSLSASSGIIILPYLT